MSPHVERLREIAAGTPSAPAAMARYLEKVRERAVTVTDADVQELKEAGMSDDEIFEQTTAEAIRQGLRRLDAAGRVLR